MLDGAVLFGGLAAARGVVLAVSGGPDSTAMMHLAAAWRPIELPMWVASVDHGLQDGSRQVAEAVVASATCLGLPGRVLTWTGEKPARGLQAKAREARYALLDRFCRDVGASHIALAHTLDDQAETVLMRLAAGSGLRGVAGMRTVTVRHGLTLVRPLLSSGKDQLQQLCTREGWPFVVDAANSDTRFTRARWRRLAPVLAAEGLTPRRLGRLADRAARADDALADAAAKVAASAAVQIDTASLGFNAALVLAAPDEIALRILASALETLHPTGSPRLERLEALLDRLRTAHAGERECRTTLHGCLIHLHGDGCLSASLEGTRRRGRFGQVQAS